MSTEEVATNDDQQSSKASLSATQKARIERNRQRALLLRSARLTAHPYGETADRRKLVTTGGARMVDSGGGFLIEPEDEDDDILTAADIVQQPGPILDGSQDKCQECGKKFSDSFLLKSFDVRICDGCRDKDKHTLITKTDAKKKYCLKDCDFDAREPPLKFIVRKNPHNERWGDMKLLFEEQVHKRAMEVWGGEEELEEQKEKREDNKEKMKKKKFEKRIKDLRQAVRTSTWHKDLSKHEHDYDMENEIYDEEEDVYTKKCKTCEHTLTYEKM